jgi:ribosomal protein S18 acetylase RimI-like enzyme
MVAQIVRQGTVPFRGVRALNPARDLRQVALLLEEAFRQDLGALHAWSRVPILRELGAALMSTAFMPMPAESLRGFVYEEGGQILGNVTLTLDESRERRWMISNVAVAEKFRRRGIARQLMAAAVDEARSRSARWVILNVRPWNEGAIRLYEGLGFETIDTETLYVRTRPRRVTAEILPVRSLRGEELRAAYELARAGMSEKLRLFRPPALSDYGMRIEDRFAEGVLDLFIFQSTERYGYFEKGVLMGTVLLHAQRIGTPHRLDVRVLPQARGRIEEGLLAAALDRLNSFPARDIETRILTSHAALLHALADAGFVPTRGLTLMAKELIKEREHGYGG